MINSGPEPRIQLIFGSVPECGRVYGEKTGGVFTGKISIGVVLAVCLICLSGVGVVWAIPGELLVGSNGSGLGVGGVDRGIYEICAADRRCDPEEGILAAKSMNATLVVVTVIDNQVDKNRSVAYYPSKIVPLAGDATYDYLNRTVKAAHQNGIKVYALINLPHELWLAKDPGRIAVYSNGKKSDTYRRSYFYRVVPPSLVVDSPEMLGDIKSIINEVAGYGVDGIALNDNFQFPSWYLEKQKETLLSSYDAATVRRFENETGRVVLGNGSSEWAGYIRDNPEIFYDWVSWRGKQVTRLLQACQQDVAESGRQIEFGPHLLVGNWVYHDNGLDYFAIAKIVDVMYLMFGDGEKNGDIPAIMRKCENATPKKIAASIYLNNTASRNALALTERIGIVYDNGARQVGLFDFNQIAWNNLSGAVGKAFASIKEST